MKQSRDDSEEDYVKGVSRKAFPSRGVVYTRMEMVDLCLDLVEKEWDQGFLHARTLDIGCGYGQFCSRLARRLASQAKAADISHEGVSELIKKRLRGVEVREHTAQMARQAVNKEIRDVYGEGLSASTLCEVIHIEDFLDWKAHWGECDIIVGNIPYVRYDNIEQLSHVESVADLRKNFTTFRGRADYSVPFLEKILALLGPEGVAVVITSNRFTRAEYGSKIRQRLSESVYQIHEIDVGNIQTFETNVSAYASIFVISGNKNTTPKYIALQSQDSATLNELSRAFPSMKSKNMLKFSVAERELSDTGAEPWPAGSGLIAEVFGRLSREYSQLDEIGASVGKGPATGANSVFIGRSEAFPFNEESRSRFLLPIYYPSNGDRAEREGEVRYILSVFEAGTRRLLELKEMPDDVVGYLKDHREQLSKRHIVNERGLKWWRTIDKFDPALREKTKVMIPDLRPGSAVVVDYGRFLPSHTTVYVTGLEDACLRGIARILGSPVAEQYRLWRSPDLGIDSPRASAPVVRKMPVPPAEKIRKLGEEGVSEGQVFRAFGLSSSEIDVLSGVRLAR